MDINYDITSTYTQKSPAVHTHNIGDISPNNLYTTISGLKSNYNNYATSDKYNEKQTAVFIPNVMYLTANTDISQLATNGITWNKSSSTANIGDATVNVYTAVATPKRSAR